MYFRGLKPDMHAIVILNHRLGKLDPRSTKSLSLVRGGVGCIDRMGPKGQVVHYELKCSCSETRNTVKIIS